VRESWAKAGKGQNNQISSRRPKKGTVRYSQAAAGIRAGLVSCKEEETFQIKVLLCDSVDLRNGGKE
jgi:hypothetical protein